MTSVHNLFQLLSKSFAKIRSGVVAGGVKCGKYFYFVLLLLINAVNL